ncbi:MAG: hypothetical protein M3297_01080 [Thermoproteota archaeon]|nr:hypothetical protein [Thermoproteota archaeon]
MNNLTLMLALSIGLGAVLVTGLVVIPKAKKRKQELQQRKTRIKDKKPKEVKTENLEMAAV